MRKSVIIGVVLSLILIAVYGLGSRLRLIIRERTMKILQTHFESQVEFSDFMVSLFPRIRVTITGLVMRHKGRTEIPPLIQIQRVSMYANILGLLQTKPRIASVQLDGLQINAPPREPGGDPLIQRTDQDLAKKYPALIQELRAYDAVITVLRAQSERPPRTFPMHHLLLRELSFDHPARFHATLKNALPSSEIDATGESGPWLPEVPRQTPAVGKYTFEDADLGTLKGIKGILSSKGSFSGPLDYLKVEGVTDTPDFAL